jgi:putative FMN-dependent luciferase-like monooxygenase
MTGARLGFFGRVLDAGTPAERYEAALEQIQHAERHGFASVWLAQHHFGEEGGGLPSPFVFLAAAAARTSRIGLGTAVLTLPIEDPLRAAEDAAVLDLLSGGRVQLGLASGGTPASFPAFGRDSGERHALFQDHLQVLLDALDGRGVRGTGSRIYPPAPTLSARIWQGTFSVAGGARIGSRGDGLMLSRTQPRPETAPDAPLHELQLPIIDAYREALPAGAPERVLASRTALVVDPADVAAARALAEPALRRFARTIVGDAADALDLDAVLRVTDTHLGTVDQVAEGLAADRTLDTATDVSFQVHSIPATHALTLRSLELLGAEVAPRLGLATGGAAADDLRDAHLGIADRTPTPARPTPARGGAS